MSLMKRKLSFVLLFTLLAIVAAVVSIYAKASRYPYDVTQDYRYDFNKTRMLTRSAEIRNNHIKIDFTIPGTTTTTLLKIHVKTTAAGKFLQPSLKIGTKENTVTEYLEPGAEGIRYINISPLKLNHKTKLTLTGKYLSIPDQEAELILYKNPDIQQAKIMILAPHPDDAEIAAYGLYSRFHENSYIVTVTAGDSGPNTYDEIYSDPVKSYMAKAKIRIWNSITVPLIGGVLPQKCVNLGFFDGTLEKMYQQNPLPVKAMQTKISDINSYRKYNISPLAKDLNGTANWNSLVSNLQYLIQTIQPDIILSPSPILDNHPDHRYSAIALFEAIRNTKLKKGKLLLYTNHFTLNEYYPYGDAGGAVSPPPNFQKLYFESIYSFNLSKALQKEKILALDAMNDLRLDTEWQTPKGAFKVGLKELLKRDFLGIEYANYYRRAIRENELFLVVDFKSLQNPEKFQALITSEE